MDSRDLQTPYLFKHKGMNFPIREGMLPTDIDAVQHFEMRPTDIFLTAYPKSGQLLVGSTLLRLLQLITFINIKHELI